MDNKLCVLMSRLRVRNSIHMCNFAGRIKTFSINECTCIINLYNMFQCITCLPCFGLTRAADKMVSLIPSKYARSPLKLKYHNYGSITSVGETF